MEEIIEQNNTAIVLATIGLIGTALAFLTQIVLALIQNRTKKEVKDLKIMVDGRLSELLAANEERDKALGRETGRAEQKAEAKVDAAVVAQQPPQPLEVKIPSLLVEIKPPPTPPPKTKT